MRCEVVVVVMGRKKNSSLRGGVEENHESH
jgi:hypothetical protein